MAGVELRYGRPAVQDSRQYTLKVLLRGHRDPMFFDIRPEDVGRLFEAVQDEPAPDSEPIDDEATSPYIVFNSTTLRVAIDLRAAIFVQFLWEPEGIKVISSSDHEADPTADDENVHVFFDRDAIPVTIGIKPEDDDDDNERNYVGVVFYLLDTGIEPQQRLHIRDEDGNSVFLRAGDISLLTCPLWLIDPEVREAREQKDL
jgi:hypothetical protein